MGTGSALQGPKSGPSDTKTSFLGSWLKFRVKDDGTVRRELVIVHVWVRRSTMNESQCNVPTRIAVQTRVCVCVCVCVWCPGGELEQRQSCLIARSRHR